MAVLLLLLLTEATSVVTEATSVVTEATSVVREATSVSSNSSIGAAIFILLKRRKTNQHAREIMGLVLF